MKDKVLISQHLCQTLRERSLICQRSMTSLSLTSRRCVYFSDLRQKGDEECFPCCALFPVHISLPQKYDFFCKFFWLLRMMWCCHSPNIHKKVGCRLCLDTDFWKKNLHGWFVTFICMVTKMPNPANGGKLFARLSLHKGHSGYKLTVAHFFAHCAEHDGWQGDELEQNLCTCKFDTFLLRKS